MIIGIDIRPMVGLRTGIQEYTEQLLTHLIPLAPEHKFKLFFSSLRTFAPNRPWMHAPNVEVVSRKIPNNLLFFLNSIFGYPRIDDLIGGADVFFSPHFFLASLSSRCRRVTTFHDLSYVRFPEFFTWRKHWWHNVEMNPRKQASFSDKIVAVSESTKKDLEFYYHIDPVNINVIPLGINKFEPAQEDIIYFKNINHIPSRYVLYLGTIEPRKNIKGLVRAFNILKEKKGFEDVELIIVGKKGWKFKETLDEIEASPFKSMIRYLGHIRDDQRALYYSCATIFVYPSFFEGFGSPVLEAMSYGVPVITSTNSSLPSVSGGAGLLIDPYNISDLAEAMTNLIFDSAIHSRMSKMGLERSSLYDWNKVAQKTLDLLVGR